MPTELLFVLTVLVIGRTQSVIIRTEARVQEIQIPGAFSSDQCEQNLRKNIPIFMQFRETEMWLLESPLQEHNL